jgi:hypothetical protein
VPWRISPFRASPEVRRQAGHGVAPWHETPRAGDENGHGD